MLSRRRTYDDYDFILYVRRNNMNGGNNKINYIRINMRVSCIWLSVHRTDATDDYSVRL